jgi:uncharacterized protein YbjT (DUF2867 family)
MNNNDKIILVTGATGKQGGAAARHLLEAGFKVRAFGRNENKPESIELKNRGAEFITGNLDDRDAIVDAMKGVYGVFGVQNFWEHGYDKELSQGINTADAVKLSGIKHFVYSSVASSDENTGLPHFDSKWEIEKYIHKLGVPYTIIKPVFFMENFEGWFAPQPQGDDKLVLSLALPKSRKLQMIAVDDVGYIAAEIFKNPEKYIGKTLTLAGDEVSPVEIADAYADVTNKGVEFNELPVDIVRASNKETADMFQWFNEKGYSANIAEIKKINPGLKDFRTWLKGRINVNI